MSNVDLFESLFRAADKPVFAYERVALDHALLVTDLEDASSLARTLDSFLRPAIGDGLTIDSLGGEAVRDVSAMLTAVERAAPDLVVTYRNLFTETWRHPFSLGEHLDVLAQHTRTPVLVLPHPVAGRAEEHALQNTDVVMAMTSHLAGDASLVNVAARVTQPKGQLWLTHVEDEVDFERIVTAISKVPTIDTDETREQLAKQLLKEPADYIRSCRTVLDEHGVDVDVRELVTMGHHLAEYKRLVTEHEVDLLVMHTKDDEQLAMHGLAYPLAVELREIPLLLI